MEACSIHRHRMGGSIFPGILLILAGILAIGMPFLAGIAASIVLGWVVLFAAAVHLVYAWMERCAGSIVPQILIGLVYNLAATYMLWHPFKGLFALTLVLAPYTAVEGVVEIVIFVRWRHLPESSWFLIDGIVSLLVSGLIWLHWPSSSLWAIGTLVGVSLVMSGVARFAMPMGRRRVLIAL